MPPDQFQGNYYVVPNATSISNAWKLCGGSMRENQKLRRHARKLMYWPSGPSEDAGADIDWDWITALKGTNIGELRVDEVINGNDNIRIIFFKADSKLRDEPLERIWLLTVFQKKKQRFSNVELKAFKAQRSVIVEREYGESG